MKEIIRIVLKGSSGYGPYELAYKDKLTLTSNSIVYEYVPEQESEKNSSKKWKYSTNSPEFKIIFDRLSQAVETVSSGDLDSDLVADVGFTELLVTYSDKTKNAGMFWTTGEGFEEIFTLIKRLVPEIEDTPEVIKTNEDYQ